MGLFLNIEFSLGFFFCVIVVFCGGISKGRMFIVLGLGVCVYCFVCSFNRVLLVIGWVVRIF